MRTNACAQIYTQRHVTFPKRRVEVRNEEETESSENVKCRISRGPYKKSNDSFIQDLYKESVESIFSLQATLAVRVFIALKNKTISYFYSRIYLYSRFFGLPMCLKIFVNALTSTSYVSRNAYVCAD